MSTDTPAGAGTPDKCLTLIEHIMTAHRKVMEAQRGSLQYAIECGKYLNTAKETVKAEPTGRWMKWLTNNCPDLNKRTARLYMLLARNEDKLDQAAINEAVIDGALSIRRAAQLITGGAADDDDDDEEDDSDGDNEDDDSDTSDNAGGGSGSSSSSSGQSSPDLVVLLKNSAPDEVFSALKSTWTTDDLDALADLLDKYLNPQAQAA
jgi:hypothetical protein